MSDDREADEWWKDDHFEQPCIMCGAVDTLNNLITFFIAEEDLKELLPGYLEDEEGEKDYGGNDFIADPVHVHRDCLRKYQQTAWTLRNLNIEAKLEEEKRKRS